MGRYARQRQPFAQRNRAVGPAIRSLIIMLSPSSRFQADSSGSNEDFTAPAEGVGGAQFQKRRVAGERELNGGES